MELCSNVIVITFLLQLRLRVLLMKEGRRHFFRMWHFLEFIRAVVINNCFFAHA